MRPERDQEYFCDGITEEIISPLTAVKGLKVVSRTSSFQFKGEAYDVRKVGQQLDIQTILGGSVRKLGNRFRITASAYRSFGGVRPVAAWLACGRVGFSPP